MAKPLALRLVLAMVSLGCVPATALAQSGISGVVKDPTGAVLPGVTVEASSPALIEKARTAVTDNAGVYNVVDLRPGVYTVTFTLSGFRTIKQEGLQLPAAFTATVNAELGLGTLEETILVSSESPVVDVRQTGRQQTLSQELLAGVPTGATAQSYAVLMPSVTQNAGTVTTAPNSFRWADLNFRGTRESSTAVDGFDTSHRLNGEGSQYQVNEGMVQEIVVLLGSAGAETQGAGIMINVIPKSGGNVFSGSFSGHYANDGFVSGNLTPDLSAKGLTTQSVRRTWDVNPAIGGPLRKDSVWFYGSYRNLGNATDTSVRRDLDPLDWVYTADVSRPTDSEQLRTRNYSVRVTWQASQKNNISIHGDHNPNNWDNRGGTTGGARTLNAPEATVSGTYRPQYVAGATWKSPLSNKLYLEGGFTVTRNKQWFARNAHDAETGEPVSPDLGAIAAQDLDSGWLFRGSHFIGNFNNTTGIRPRFAASYITGSHTAKFGLQGVRGSDQAERYRIGDYIVRLRSGTPVNIEVWGPENRTSRLTSIGLYGQDQWVLKRATLNLGVRYDYVKTSADPQDLPANTMLPARHFDGIGKIIHYHDLSPRVGIAYDLVGNNRTAIKASFNRYLYPQDFTGGRHPTALAQPNTTRDWRDDNRNFIPDCDFRNPQLNGECGILQNLNFGSIASNPPQFDPDIDGGFGHRPYSWETTAGVQHQLMPGVGVEVSYYRRWQGNQQVMQNLRTQPSDYLPFCVMTPADARLPGGGGQELCGFYDFTAQSGLTGQVQSYSTFTKKFGDEVWVYDGLEINVNTRIRGGVQLTGGSITQRIRTESCYTVNSPMWSTAENRGALSTGGIAPALSNAAVPSGFCKNTPPLRTTVKFMGVYPLPLWGVQVSGAIQALPGPTFNGTRTYGRGEILGLPAGRTLSTATVNLTIVEPNSVFGAYVTKMDARVSKIVRVGGYRLTGSLDLFNLFNSAAVLGVNTTVGPNYLYPTQALGGRLYRLSARLDF